jgi:hypothetical protein
MRPCQKKKNKSKNRKFWKGEQRESKTIPVGGE